MAARTPIQVRGACPHDCPDTCAWIATVDDGVVTSVRGDPEHPLTAGHLCIKVQHYEERLYHPDRLLTPLVRTGPKGAGHLREATWDEALARVAAGLSDAVERGGSTSVMPWSYMGTQGVLQGGPSMDRRFLNRLGAADMLGTICFAAGGWAWGLTYPGRPSADIEDAVHARSVVVWGANMVSTHLHLWKPFLDARKRGATIVCVDPVRTRTARAADIHLALRPGSDAALALGVMHVLFHDGLADDRFLAEQCVGADDLRERAAAWPVERSAAATDLDPAAIEGFARLLADGPTFIKVGPGAQRHAHSGQAIRAVIALPAVTGAWRHRGGGALVESASAFPYPVEAMARPDLRPAGAPRREVNMVQLGRALAGTLDGEPPLTGLVVHNGNPAVVCPDSHAVHEGLARDDLFTLVIEQMPTETVAFADVVLPATTQLEHLDVLWSWGHRYLTLNRPAVAPRGHARPNTEIFRLIAGALGFDDPAFADDDEQLLATYLAAHPDPVVEQLLERGWAKVQPSSGSAMKIQLRSEGAASLGLDAVPDALDAPPADGAVTVLTPKSHHFLNSQYPNHARLRRMAGEPVIEVSAADAASAGVVDGQLVALTNERGRVEALARISDAVRPGTVVLASNWWHRDLPGGWGPNALTGQDVADLGGAPVLAPRAHLTPSETHDVR